MFLNINKEEIKRHNSNWDMVTGVAVKVFKRSQNIMGKAILTTINIMIHTGQTRLISLASVPLGFQPW